MLNQDQYEAKWTEIKGGIRNIWGRLTDEELERTKGNLSEIPSLVENKYNESREEIEKKFQMLVDSFDNQTDKNLDPDVSSYHRSPVDKGSQAEDRIARH